jgi:DNA-binding HxlR family transcriptional regulator
MLNQNQKQHKKCDHLCFCPLDGVIDIISKKWSLLIINTIGNHDKLRYKNILNDLPGISPKTLSDTLKKLCEQELVIRESFSEIPPRVEYHLSENGKKLRDAIMPLLKWAALRDKGCNCISEKCDMPGHKIEVRV